MSEDGETEKENLKSFNIPKGISVSAYKKEFEARIPTDWQHLLGLLSSPRLLYPPDEDERERMKALPPKVQEAMTFFRAISIEYITELYDESRKFFDAQRDKELGKGGESLEVLGDAPGELQKLTQQFPRVMALLHDYKNTWDISILCENCGKTANISDLEVYTLNTKHSDAIAIHCRPDFEIMLHNITPNSVDEAYRRRAIITSREKDGKIGETLFGTDVLERTDENKKSNMGQIESLVQKGRLVFRGLEVPRGVEEIAEKFPNAIAAIHSHKDSWNLEIKCPKCKRFVGLSELKIFELGAEQKVAMHCQPTLKEANNDLVEFYTLFDKFAIFRNSGFNGSKETMFESDLKEPFGRKNQKENDDVIRAFLGNGSMRYRDMGKAIVKV